MDPDLYGRPQFADLNWKLQKFEIPSDLNPDYFSVAFLNDHCCDLSGGDRNFFVDWLAFTGWHYPVAKGKQATRCRDKNETLGSIYCGGNIDFTDFENLVLSEKVTALISAKDDETSAERMVFQGNSAFRWNKNWNVFRIGLVGHTLTGSLHTPWFWKLYENAQKIRATGYFCKFQNDYFPECVGGTFSRSAFKTKRVVSDI